VPVGNPNHQTILVNQDQEFAMSEIITKAQRIASIIADTTIEPWKRAAQGLEAFSGVTIS